MSDPTLLARPSGGFAMLAVDQREALRDMMARARSTDISDADMTEFKVSAARTLTPYASAALIDTDFGWDAAVEQGAVDPSCALIAAADRFVAGNGEFVREATFDTSLDYTRMKSQGAKALKLLVLWREDQDPQQRIDEVRRFVAACRELDLVSIIEPVSRTLGRRPDRRRSGCTRCCEGTRRPGSRHLQGGSPVQGRRERRAGARRLPRADRQHQRSVGRPLVGR